MARYDFSSDNAAGAAPEALAALIAANEGYTSGYGTDVVTAKAGDLVRELLDCDAEVHFVTSGTAANSVALQAICRPFEAVVAHEHAHIITDEAGAPLLFGHGLGLIGLPGQSGKIDPAALERRLAEPDVSYAQSPAALSVTNATEYGLVYSADEIRALTDRARAQGLATHLDGARLANAAAAGFDVRMLKDLGIDILVIGGAKSGMPASEAIVLFDRKLERRFDARLKQSGQLPSKGRFLAAPWIGMLESGGWLRHAAHANAMARRLADVMPYPVRHRVEANAVFADMPEAAHQRLMDNGWYVYRFTDNTVRFMCSWATTQAAIDELAEALRG